MDTSLEVPNVVFDFDVSVRHCLLSTHTSKSNLTSGTRLHALIRTHNFDFDNRFWPISTPVHSCQKPYIEVELDLGYFQWYTPMIFFLWSSLYNSQMYAGNYQRIHLSHALISCYTMKETLQVKNFAGTRIRTHDLPTQLFSIIVALSYRLRPLMAGTVRP